MSDSCELCESREPMFRGEFEPFAKYRKGDTVTDSPLTYTDGTKEYKHDEQPGTFEALNCLAGGLLPPRYVAIDKSDRWKRVE